MMLEFSLPFCLKTLISVCMHFILLKAAYYMFRMNRLSRRNKLLHSMRVKHKDSIPPILISGHQFTMISQHQTAAREYLHAHKLMPDDPFINLCGGTRASSPPRIKDYKLEHKILYLLILAQENVKFIYIPISYRNCLD